MAQSEYTEIHLSRLNLFSVFILALVLRLLYLAAHWSMLPDWNVDALGYHQLALNLLNYGQFSMNLQPPLQPEIIRVPGYPMFMALVYSVVGVTPRAVLIAQALLDSCTALLTLGITARLAQGKWAAIAAGTLYALYPTTWIFCSELFVEIVLAFFITLMFFILLHALTLRGRASIRTTIYLGLACALGLLVKPNVLPLPLILGGALVVQRRFRLAMIFALTTVLLLSPWLIRNAMVFGHPMLSDVFENNLARVSAPATLAEARGEKVIPWSPQWESLYNEVERAAAHQQPVLFATPVLARTAHQLDQVQIELAKAARNVITMHVPAFVRSHIKGTLRGLQPQDHRFWFEEITGQTWDSVMPQGMIAVLRAKGWRAVPPLAVVLFLGFAGLYIIAGVSALIGAWRALHYNTVAAVAMLLVVTYMIVLPGPISYDRFWVPIIPLVAVFIACIRYRKAVTDYP